MQSQAHSLGDDLKTPSSESSRDRSTIMTSVLHIRINFGSSRAWSMVRGHIHYAVPLSKELERLLCPILSKAGAFPTSPLLIDGGLSLSGLILEVWYSHVNRR